MVAVPAFSLAPFALRNLSQEPGRFFVSLLLCVISVAIFMWMVRRPKPELPPTWAMSMLGATAVFALFLLIYGVVPHEWLTWADSSLGLREDRILFNAWAAIDFSGRALRDIVATVIYIVGLGSTPGCGSRGRSGVQPSRSPLRPPPRPNRRGRRPSPVR